MGNTQCCISHRKPEKAIPERTIPRLPGMPPIKKVKSAFFVEHERSTQEEEGGEASDFDSTYELELTEKAEINPIRKASSQLFELYDSLTIRKN